MEEILYLHWFLRLGACEAKQQWQMAMKLLCDLDDRHELQASILFLDI